MDRQDEILDVDFLCEGRVCRNRYTLLFKAVLWLLCFKYHLVTITINTSNLLTSQSAGNSTISNGVNLPATLRTTQRVCLVDLFNTIAPLF